MTDKDLRSAIGRAVGLGSFAPVEETVDKALGAIEEEGYMVVRKEDWDSLMGMKRRVLEYMGFLVVEDKEDVWVTGEGG